MVVNVMSSSRVEILLIVECSRMDKSVETDARLCELEAQRGGTKPSTLILKGGRIARGCKCSPVRASP